MKSISTELKTHLAGEVTTLATCWKLTRKDAVVMGFTDHDKDLIIEGVTYKAASGFTPTAIANSADLSVDNLDVEGMLDDTSITEADILAGKYDFAAIEVFAVNYEDLTQGALQLRSGWLGEIAMKNNRFTAEVRGLMQKLTQNIGELYSPSCRAQLGDARCGVNLTGFTFTGTVTGVTDRLIFDDSSRTESAGTFTFGNVTFMSGANSGISMEVKEYTQGRMILALPMPNAITIGDNYTIQRGCDKTLTTCRDVFSNVVNFRGEPHVPGIDKMLETASTRNEFE
jgi:uncharacterized phage protein (TIGR02218 family)